MVNIAQMVAIATKNTEYTKKKKAPCDIPVAVVNDLEEEKNGKVIKDGMFKSVLEVSIDPSNKDDKTRTIICRDMDDYIYVVNWFFEAPYITDLSVTHRKLQAANITVDDVRSIRGADDALDYSNYLSDVMIRTIDDRVLFQPKKFKRFSECFRI